MKYCYSFIMSPTREYFKMKNDKTIQMHAYAPQKVKIINKPVEVDSQWDIQR